MRKLAITAVSAILLFGLIQLIPVDRDNPQVTADFDGPADVEALLRRACYDCHSNETVWPWYAHVAPVSWMLADHVEEGREHLNFSRWGDYPAQRRRHASHEMVEHVEKGEMPLPTYLAMHDEAQVSDADLELLRKWSQQVAATTPADEAPQEIEVDEIDDDD